jgi:hypothetical protein
LQQLLHLLYLLHDVSFLNHDHLHNLSHPPLLELTP